MCGHSFPGGRAPQSWGGAQLEITPGQGGGGWLHPLIKGERSSIFMLGQQGKGDAAQNGQKTTAGCFFNSF